MAEWLQSWSIIILTGVYVIATIAICIFNYKSAKATREQIVESQRQFEESNRPYVNVIFEIINGGLACLSISNNGNKIAENVKIHINDKFLNLMNARDREEISQFTSRSIRIGINQKWTLCIGSHLDLTKLSKEKIIIDINYNDGERQFNDTSIISLNGYLGTLIFKNYHNEMDKSLKKIATILDENNNLKENK
ncbi:hypothetical protein [Clostridium uliginosum]|uniref:Uncharacterized protein n=1 Tax=Clostridium uliginosum TaxID=119641 RepID=A0A1I1GSR1_9CLOT|nr:hypothetical protein [Clostridium uliginosum]SFC14515.1 hypothetical protein SAMN05421842_10146 [Clostridium uliginosum]